MDASGPIFAVLVVACLFYLVPRRLAWRIPTQEQIDQDSPLHLSMKMVHKGVRPIPEQPDAAVSTLLMRRAGRRAALRLARRAEKRRKAVFAALSAICVLTIPIVILSWSKWWVSIVAFAVVMAWVGFSHLDGRRVQAQLDAIVADTELGDDEATLAVQIAETPAADATTAIFGPNGEVQPSLWEPITVAPATYISSPATARTVRTIDLKAPAAGRPVTLDLPEPDASSIAV